MCRELEIDSCLHTSGICNKLWLKEICPRFSCKRRQYFKHCCYVVFRFVFWPIFLWKLDGPSCIPCTKCLIPDKGETWFRDRCLGLMSLTPCFEPASQRRLRALCCLRGLERSVGLLSDTRSTATSIEQSTETKSMRICMAAPHRRNQQFFAVNCIGPIHYCLTS